MRRPPFADLALAAVGALLSALFIQAAFSNGVTWYGVTWALLHVCLTVALATRSTHRRASFAATYGLLAVMAVVMYFSPVNLGVSPVILCAPLALYKVTRHEPATWGVTALLLGVAGSFVSPINYLPGGGSRVLVPILILGMVGTYLWANGQRRTEIAFKEQLKRERETHQRESAAQLHQAKSAERARIAREIHDIVAHSLAVVNVQASTALAIGTEEQMRESLASVKDSSKEALTEVRSLVGVLRDDNGSRDVSGDLRRLPGLVQEARSAGVHLDALLPGEETLGVWQEQWAASARLAVVRVIQEALSNVIKHGGPSPHARLTLTEQNGTCNIEVGNDSRRRGESMGFGLVGLRERVELTGGTFEAGPHGMGFALVARIPVEAHEKVTR